MTPRLPDSFRLSIHLLHNLANARPLIADAFRYYAIVDSPFHNVQEVAL